MLYDYNKNVNITTTPNGDKVITMNSAIYTEMVNKLYFQYEQEMAEGHVATADNTHKLWRKLVDAIDTIDIDK